MKLQQLSEIYRMLVICLGEPVKEFEWTRCDAAGNIVNRKTYTPKSFYDEFIGEDLEQLHHGHERPMPRVWKGV